MGCSRPGSPLAMTGAIQCRRASWRCRLYSRQAVPKPASRSPLCGFRPTQTKEASASTGARSRSRPSSAASEITARSGPAPSEHRSFDATPSRSSTRLCALRPPNHDQPFDVTRWQSNADTLPITESTPSTTSSSRHRPALPASGHDAPLRQSRPMPRSATLTSRRLHARPARIGMGSLLPTVAG